uniref:RNA pseudouridine synthase superfamily protein n=1 Tax=Toxoplasma gondii TgCATBr9 TaxID=943120 RepID=A0A2T6IVU9_TOXGO|nr:RNA pseudouridine synthase superfamily protein [Toxoplasma gondii TgCATBr9]
MSLPPQRRTVAPAQLAAGAQAHPHVHLLHAQVRDPRGDGDSAGAAGTRVETHLEDLQEGSPFLVAVAGGTGQTPVEFGPVPASPVFQELYRNPIFLQVRAAACAGLRRLARESRGSDFLAGAETCAEVRKERFASRWPSHVAEASSLRSANGVSTEEAKGSSSTSSPETHSREGRQLPWRPTVSWYAFRHEPAVCRLAEELFSAFGKAAFVDLDLFNAIVDVLTPDWLVSEVHPHERTVHPQPPSSLSVEPSSSSSLTAELPPHAQSSSPSSSSSSSPEERRGADDEKTFCSNIERDIPALVAGTAEETAKETGRQASSTALAGGVLTALETLARAISVILRDEERRPPGLPVPPRFYESLPFALTNVLEVAVDFRVCLNGTRSRRKRNSPTVRTLADGVHRLCEKPRLREALEGDKETTHSRSGGESGDRGEEAAEQRSRQAVETAGSASRLLAAPFRGLLSRQVEDEDARGRREPSGRGVAAGGDRREGSSPQASPISHRRGLDSSDPAEALGLSGDETRERGDSERRGEATSRCVAGAAWEHGAAKEAAETRCPEDAKDQLLLDVLEEEHRLLSGGLREILMSEDWARALYSLAILFPQTSLPFRQLYLAACILPCSSVEGDGGQTALMPTLKPDEKPDASSQRPTEMLTSSPQAFAPKSTSPFLPSPSSSSASSASSASPSFSSSLSAPAASTVLSDVVAFSAFCQICRLLVLSTSSPFSPQVSSLSRVPWKRSDACAALGWPDDVVSPSFCLENPVPFFRSQLLRPLVRETLEDFLVSPRCSVSIPSSSRPSPAPLSSPSLSPLPHASPFSPPRSSPSSSRSAPSSSPLSESWGAGVSPLGHEETDEATRREPLRLLFRAVGASLARRLERETDRQLQCLPAHRGRRFDWGGNPKEEREGEQRQKKSRYVFCVADDADTTRLLDSTLRGGMLSPCSLSSLSFASPRSSACPPSSPGDADGEARRSGGSWIGQSGDDDPDCLLFPSAVASLSATQNISEPLYEKILTLAFSTGEDYWRRREKGELNRSEAQRTTARHLRMPRPLPPARIHPPSPQAAYASSIYCRKERTLGTVRSFTSASSPRPCASSPARGTPSVASAFPSPHPSPSALGRLETPFAEAAGEGQRHTASPEKRELSGSTFEKERSLFSFFLPAETLQTEAEEAPLPRLERDAEPHALEPSTQTLQEPPGPLREKEREAKRGRDKPAETEQASEKDAPVPKARECAKPEENAKDTNAEQREETGKIGGLLRYQNDRRRSPWSGDKDEKRQGLAASRRWLDIVKEGEKNRYSKDLPHVVWQSKHLMVLYKPPFWRVNLERSEKPETVRERIALSAPSVAASLPESPLQFSPSLRKRTLEILARGGLSEPLHAYMQIALGRTQDAHGEWTGEGARRISLGSLPLHVHIIA